MKKVFSLPLIGLFFLSFFGHLEASSLTTNLTPQAQNQETSSFNLEDVIHLLETDSQRHELLEQLKNLKLSLEKTKGDSFEPDTSILIESTIQTLKSRLEKKIAGISQSYQFLKNNLTRDRLLFLAQQLGIFLLALASGELFLRLFNFSLKKTRIHFEEKHQNKNALPSYSIFFQILTEILGLGIFLITSFSVVSSFTMLTSQHYLIISMIGIAFLYKLIMFILDLSLKTVFSRKKNMALPHDIDQKTYAFMRLIILNILIILSISMILALEKNLKTLVFILQMGLVIHVSIISFRFVTYLQNQTTNQKKFEKTWPYFFKTYLACLPLLALLVGGNNLSDFMAQSLQTTFLFIIITMVFGRLPSKFDLFLNRLSQKYTRLKGRKKNYLFLLNTFLWIAGSIFMVGALNSIWGYPFFAWIWTMIQDKWIHSLVILLILLSAGIGLWEASEFALNQYIKIKKIEYTSNQEKSDKIKRLETLIPLFNTIIRVFIVLLIGLMVISEMGFNITPLLAGASVLGIALSLGAQSLVKDFINGCFMLFENTISIGDHIEVGAHQGSVETLSLRSLSLRDTAGAVHTIPFSTITTVINHTKNYAKSQFLLSLDLKTPFTLAEQLLRDIEQRLQMDSTIQGVLMGPLNIDGIQTIEGDHYTIKANLKVSPGQQWQVERLFNKYIAEILPTLPFSIYQLKHTIVMEKNEE